MNYPFERAVDYHRNFYVEGTFENFWTEFRNNCTDNLIKNKFTSTECNDHYFLIYDSQVKEIKKNKISFINLSEKRSKISLGIDIISKSSNIFELFSNLSRVTAHTHLIGDFRRDISFFVDRYAGQRFFMFDGSGTCLLLSIMFQCLAQLKGYKTPQVVYSATKDRMLTHAYCLSEDTIFDVDQKQFYENFFLKDVSMSGYILQQLGVATYEYLSSWPRKKRYNLLQKKSDQYFEFYDESKSQYMYGRTPDFEKVRALFCKAQDATRQVFSIYSDDYVWKSSYLKECEKKFIKKPFLLSKLTQRCVMEFLPLSRLEIGLSNNMPQELNDLSTLFLGRIPATFVVNTNHLSDLVIPEHPWMIYVEGKIDQIMVNGKIFDTTHTTCGRFSYVGAGQLEILFDGTELEYRLDVACADRIRDIQISFPINSLAVCSGLLNVEKLTGEIKIEC